MTLVIRQENQKICEHATAIEERVGVLEDVLPLIKKDLQLIKTQIKGCGQKLEVLENRQT